jgi:hypothetical protein
MLALVVVTALVAGCGAKSPSRPAPSVALRSCSMVGSGGLAPGYRRRALILGPLALANVSTYSARQPLPGEVDGRYGAYEVIAIVNAGAAPTLTLPRSEWSTVGLLYDPAKLREDGAYRIRDLDQVVRFRACRAKRFNHGVSQFDEGFVVSRPQCVRFTVSTPNGRTYEGSFPAAAPCSRVR